MNEKKRGSNQVGLVGRDEMLPVDETVPRTDEEREIARAVGWRMGQLMLALKQSTPNFAKHLGTTEDNLKMVLLGERTPSMTMLNRLRLQHSVNVDWLVAGDKKGEEMFVPLRLSTPAMQELLHFMQMPLVEKEIFAKMAELKQRQLSKVGTGSRRY